MNKPYCFAGLLFVSVILFSESVFAQQNEPAPPSAADTEKAVPKEPDVPAGQEVEINEDNYRQFMELKDTNLQRDVIPEDAFKPGSGLQKLEKLPEESQKHLRNELREIIVQGDPWQPGDEDKEFPYVPSAAASKDAALEKQELEAWGELVDSYNQREAQIYENSSGTQAAAGAEQGSNGKPGNGAGQTGSTGQSGEGSQGQQTGQESKPGQNDDTGTYSPNSANDPNAKNTAGVSQNAMEFLQGLGQGGHGSGEGDQEASAENGQGGESPMPSEGQSQAQSGQQGSSDQRSAANSGTANSAPDPNAKSTAGASQNAMEFLKGNAGQGDSPGGNDNNSSAASAGQGESQQGEPGEAQQTGQSEAQEDGSPGSQGTGQKDGQAEAQNTGQEQGESESDGKDEGKADSQDDGQSQDGQQTETAEKTKPSLPPVSTTPVSPAEAEEESTAGASQNALEYLKKGSVRASDSTDNEADKSQPQGTLTIQDLLNARGVGGSTGTVPATTAPEGEQQPDENKPDKDGGG